MGGARAGGEGEEGEEKGGEVSDGEVLETMIRDARALKSRLGNLSDAAHVHGERFIELGRALAHGTALRPDFPFEYCDVEEARRILAELPELADKLRNVENRIRRRTAIE